VTTAGNSQSRRARRPGGLLWHRNFLLLWTGETVSQTGSAMAVVGVPLLAVEVLHASTFAVSALTAAAFLPWLLIGLPAGAWVDRLPPRPLMVTCDVVSALLCNAASFLVSAGCLLSIRGAISERAGIDVHPVDAADPAARAWLEACAPPEETALSRLAAALDLAARHPARIVAGDVVDALPGVLASLDAPRVIVTDAYLAVFLPPGRRAQLADILAEAGRERPVTWLSLDPWSRSAPPGATACRASACRSR